MTPAWMDESYLLSLAKKIDQTLTGSVEHVIVESATGNGENYASVLIRVKVIFSTGGCLSLIVKTITADPVAKGVLTDEFNVHNKEMHIYEHILSKYKSITGFELTPKVFEVNRNNDAILFEDLSAAGFSVANRFTGLDETHCRLVVQSLAKLHASSMVLNHTEPNVFQPFSDGLFNRKIKLLHDFFYAMLDTCAEEVSTWPEFKTITKKLVELKDDLIERGSCVFDYHEDETFVFLHSDLWTTNLMFKYDDEQSPIDIKFIDFQMSSYGSPVIDLIYFIYTSAEIEVRFNKTQELLKYYWENLSQSLTKLNCVEKIPSEEQLQHEWDRKFFHGKFNRLE